MRIAINAQLLKRENSGVEKCIYNLIEGLAKTDKTNKYFIYFHSSLNNTHFMGNFLLRKTKFPNNIRLARIIWEQALFPFILEKDRIDILHSPGYVLPLICPKPAIVTIPDIIALLFPEMCKISNTLHYSLLIPKVVRKAKRIITFSNSTKKDLISHLRVPEDRIEVIYPGVEDRFKPIRDFRKLERIRRKYNLPKDIILYVGNLEPKKNIPFLIKAFSDLKKNKQIRHKLAIVGKKGWLYKDGPP